MSGFKDVDDSDEERNEFFVQKRDMDYVKEILKTIYTNLQVDLQA